MREWITAAEAEVLVELRFPHAPAMKRALVDAIESGRVASRDVWAPWMPKQNLDFVPTLNPGQNYPGYGGKEISRSSLLSWLNEFATNPADKAASSTGSTKRGKVRSMAAEDQPIIEKMRQAITSGQAPTATAAALAFVDEAVGGGNTESRVRRLERRYRSTYGE